MGQVRGSLVEGPQTVWGAAAEGRAAWFLGPACSSRQPARSSRESAAEGGSRRDVGAGVHRAGRGGPRPGRVSSPRRASPPHKRLAAARDSAACHGPGLAVLESAMKLDAAAWPAELEVGDGASAVGPGESDGLKMKGSPRRCCG